MSNSLIISRFDEDLNWLKSINNFKKIIYNKGNKIQDKSLGEIININNIGRESHTWIYHILNNYEKLDDINIFLQGRIDDLGCMAYKDPNYYINPVKKYGFAASRYGILGPLHWGWHVGVERDIRYKDSWMNGQISRSKIGFRNFSKNLFPEIPFIVATSYGGCFAIKKELIQKYDVTFYENLLSLLNHHKNPIEGHYMERLWCYMFTTNKTILRAFKDVLHTKFERFISKNSLNKP